MKNITYYLFFGSFAFLQACTDFVEIPQPDNQITAKAAFQDDASAKAVLNGIYGMMMESSQRLFSGSVSLYAGLAADELRYYSSSINDEFTNNTLSIVNDGTLSTYFWDPGYAYIYAANRCLEGVEQANALSLETKNSIRGEALFIRACAYYYLSRLFGPVPLVTTTDYEANANLPRSPLVEVNDRIAKDLAEAEKLLNIAYSAEGRVRPNKLAVMALGARFWLEQEQWERADSLATAVINNPALHLEENLDDVFFTGSREAIWQLQPTNPNYNTWEATLILPASPTALPTFVLTDDLARAFRAEDKRRQSWVGQREYAEELIYYPIKYKERTFGAPLTESYMVLRLAEQYLIRAEARAKLGRPVEALADLNRVHQRALSDVLVIDKEADLLQAIYQEKRLELFSEWGIRWLDLKRTGMADQVLGRLKPDTWKATAIWWPIPYSQIMQNPSLQQNEGYE